MAELGKHGLKSQWDCVLQNLGEWQGSFTQFTPQGEVLDDIPSVIFLIGVNQNQTIHLVLRRFYRVEPGSAERQPKELTFEFSAPGVGALFFESGAFSQGSPYFRPRSPFVAEFCLLDEAENAQRRSRIVQQFNADSGLEQITLIREKRAGADRPERPPLTLDDLLGTWQGKAITRLPHDATPEHHSSQTTLTYAADESISRNADGTTLEIQTHPAIRFEQAGQVYQTLLLPDGVFSTSPVQICAGHPFVLEVGWLRSPNERQRLIRRYDHTGSWVNVTWVTERRIS